MLNKVLRPAAALAIAASSLGAAPAQTQKKPAAAAPSMKVYLTPTCGCCGKWTEHVTKAGFTVMREVSPTLANVPARKRVPSQLISCHIAEVGPYVVEGHVPADVIKKLLKEQPKIAGIAVRGMPEGSPGMEGPNPEPYAVTAFRADGTTYEFARR